MPGFLNGAQEAETVQRLADRHVPLVLIFNNLTPEYRDSASGIDYNN